MTVVLSSNPSGRVAVSGPWITQLEIRHVSEAVSPPWYGSFKRWNERFEIGFAQYLGVPLLTAPSSRTSAFHRSLAALGIGPGDGVIVHEATFNKGGVPMDRVCRDVRTLLFSGPTLA